MTRMALRKIFAPILLIILTGNAHAGLIVDTGPGINAIPYSLYDKQFLAAEFTITQDVVVNSVEGWMRVVGALQTATVALYSDGGTVPGAELFSAAFTTVQNGVSTATWEGGSGLGWILSSGTYWAAFEVRAGQTLVGSMPSPALSPLGMYAFTTEEGGWIQSPLNFGIRIDANSAVPAPATLALFGLGLASLAISRRKRSLLS